MGPNCVWRISMAQCYPNLGEEKPIWFDAHTDTVWFNFREID